MFWDIFLGPIDRPTKGQTKWVIEAPFRSSKRIKFWVHFKKIIMFICFCSFFFNPSNKYFFLGLSHFPQKIFQAKILQRWEVFFLLKTTSTECLLFWMKSNILRTLLLKNPLKKEYNPCLLTTHLTSPINCAEKIWRKSEN